MNLINILNKPFQKITEKMLSTLRNSGLNSDEETIINDSANKYALSIRNALLVAILEIPAIIYSDPDKLLGFMMATATITGVAWFAISLKEVKEKFTRFGIELTQDMLEAFLLTVFSLSLISIVGYISTDLINIFNLPQNINEKFMIFIKIPIIFSILRIIWLTFNATIKFDANDAMLTGSADAARKFFERSTSKLHEIATILKEPHEQQTSNYLIYEALSKYMRLLKEKNYKIKDELEDSIKNLLAHTQLGYKEFDKILLPIFEGILNDENMNKNDQIIREKNDRLKNINLVQAAYNSNNPPSQFLADAVISDTLEFLYESSNTILDSK